MGAGQSSSGSHPHPPARALHILRVTPSSPASQTNIEAFFDFVIGLEGDTFSSRKTLDAAELERIVEAHEGRNLSLQVWNSKNLETRVVNIVPSRAWSLAAPNSREPDTQPSLLGLSMRMCEPEFAIDNVWHVMDVLEGSPAESAGLVPYGDWIIGWSGGVLGAEGDFYDLVEAHIDKPLRVYVYSYDFDTIREVVLVPNRQWGGEGLLGCVFGFGLLHRIPPVQENREPGSLPPELHDASNEFEEQELFVPADTSGSDFELHDDEHHHHHHQQHHDYPVEYGSPDASQDYSYSYSNRGAAYQQGHPAAATSIPEEREEYDDDSRSHSPASSHSHSHSHSSHDHDHDHGHNHHHDHHHDHHHHHSEDSETSYHRTPTPESSRALGGVYSNGVPYNGVRSRTSIPENFGNGRSSFRAAGQRQAGPDEDEAEGDSDHELSSEHDGSLTSVE